MRPRLFAARFVVLICLAVLYSGCSRRDPPTTTEVLSRSTRALDDINKDPANTIPDDVLNAARCMVILPGGSPRGVRACRDQQLQWRSPELIESPHRPDKNARLMLVMSTRARQSLTVPTDHGWHLLAGPLTRETPLAGSAQVSADLLCYRWDGQTFSGAPCDALDLKLVAAQVAPFMAESFLTSLTSFADTILPTGIIIHHSGVVPSETVDERAIDTFHAERGFDVVCFGREYHVAYHYLILGDGRVQPGRPERCEGAHARGYNSYLGIALVGDFSRQDNPHGRRGLMRPTAKQLDALIRLCRELRNHYRIPLQHILRHSDIAATHCPGDRFPFQELLIGSERP